MPNVPATKFIRRMPDQDTPSRRPVVTDIGAAQAPWVALRQTAEATSDLGVALAEASLNIRVVEDKAREQDYLNRFNSWSRDFILEQKKLSGENALGITKSSEPLFHEQIKGYLDRLPTEASKQAFYARAMAHMDSHLNSLAVHELSQLEKYRNDTVQAAYTSAHEDIRLSTGDPKVVEETIREYEKTIQGVYFGQDTTRMRQNHRSLLEKAGREARDRYRETVAFDIVRDKFTKPDEKGFPTMDYVAAKNYLLDNPDNVPEISELTIDKRERLSNLIWNDGVRAEANRRRTMNDNAGKMWATYNKLISKEPTLPGEPASFLEWHRLAEQMTMSGQLDDSVLKTAIAFQKGEQALERQLAAAAESEKRRIEADLRRVREETERPFKVGNPAVMAHYTRRILDDPKSVPKEEILGLIGRGLSIDNVQELMRYVDGAAGRVWQTPLGKVVKSNIESYRRDYSFHTDEPSNLAGYNSAITYFQTWLEKNPNATGTQADEELRRFMYPYVRSSFKKFLDRVTDSPPILPVKEK